MIKSPTTPKIGLCWVMISLETKIVKFNKYRSTIKISLFYVQSFMQMLDKKLRPFTVSKVSELKINSFSVERLFESYLPQIPQSSGKRKKNITLNVPKRSGHVPPW